MKIYELIGDCTEPLTPEMSAFLDLYHQGRTAYVAQEFHRAIAYFDKAQILQPNDLAVQIYIDRAQSYIQRPPGVDWDGVHVMTTK